MTKRTIIINPGDLVEILVIQDPDLPRTKAEFNWQLHGSRESVLIQHAGYRAFQYSDPFVKFKLSKGVSIEAMPPTSAADLLIASKNVLNMCLFHGDFRNGVTDPTGSIDEGDVNASRLLNELEKAIAGAEGVTSAADAADAARYRWLKERNSGPIGIVAWHRDEEQEMVLVDQYADDAIDSAMISRKESCDE